MLHRSREIRHVWICGEDPAEPRVNKRLLALVACLLPDTQGTFQVSDPSTVVRLAEVEDISHALEELRLLLAAPGLAKEFDSQAPLPNTFLVGELLARRVASADRVLHRFRHVADRRCLAEVMCQRADPWA